MTASRIIKFSFLVLLYAYLGACNRSSSEAPGRPRSVTLQWTASKSKISGYDIYRSTDANTPPGFLAVTGSNETQYVDKSVEAGRTYYYSVKSFDAAGVESTAATISATIPRE